MSKPQQKMIEVQSIVSAKTGEPFVQIRGGDGQLTPGEARDLAMSLLQGAEAAETDALITRFARQALGDERAAVLLIAELRKMRGSAPPTDWRDKK